MPRIDPFQLLKCLSVLLGPTGGIKSKEEVHRLANLMTKFSKKLVSKCIYIQILKTTNTELLSQFMDAGGWSLVHMWLTDGIVAKNWALIQELLELLHLCPVKIDRLKSNNCPKLIKGLSKEVSHQGVRILATRLVEQWLKIVKGEAAPNSVPAQIIGNIHSQISENSMNENEQYEVSGEMNNDHISTDDSTVQVQDLETTTNNYTIETNQSQSQPIQLHILNNPAIQQQHVQHMTKQSYVVVGNGTSVIPSGPVCKITIRDGNQVLVKVETDAANINNALNSSHEMNGEIANSEIASNQDIEADYDEMTVERLDDDYDGAINEQTADPESRTVSATKASENNEVSSNAKSRESVKEMKDNNVVSDGNKSSDKENRDSHKMEDKKSNVSTDKKSETRSSSTSKSGSSSSSSKHSSSSHRTGSSSHRSSHRSSSSSSRSSSSKDKSSRDKDRHHSSSSKHSSSSSSSKNKSERDKEREKEKEKQKKDQADKDKATLEKVQAQAISSKLGKIPKKKMEDEKSSSESLLRKSSTDSRESSKENKDKTDPKKGPIASTVAASVLEKKNISISIENRKNSLDSTRPKTVKTFNSKFRSTGLEEEVKPPPPRSATKKPAGNILDKKIIPAKPLTTMKRTSPLRETSAPSDKRAKLSLDPPICSPTEEKKGAIKLISPKPKPMVLQESDMFMDALTASTKSKEPRKRKRRTSVSKDGSSDSKKSELTNADGGHDSPSHPSSPQSADDRSPLALKPNFKFYQDTLETDEDKEDKQEQLRKEKDDESDEIKLDADGNEDYETSVSNLVKTEMAALADKAKEADEDLEETKESDSPEREGTNAESAEFTKNERSVSPIPEIRYVDGLRSVLLLQKRKGAKKSLKWKTELESIRYFELDETERVNVTKTFTDMKQMEKQGEREAFQMARKLSTEDTMEEKTRWKALVPIDLAPALVEPGKDSREKEIQYAREKGILQALYFNRSMIPDSAAEPDEERHHVMTDPKIIPLEDLTGNKDSEKDFTGVAWPEPKPQLPPPTPVMQPPGYHFPAGFPHTQPPMIPTMGPPGPMGPMPPMPPGPRMGPGPMNHMGPDMGGPMVAPPGGGGGWRTGDGKVVVPDVGMNQMQQPMPNMPGGFPPGMDGPMGPPGMMGPPMYNQQEGFGMMGPEDMGYGNFQGPPGPGMFGPPNYPGGPPRGGGPMHGNRGRGAGPGWFRGGGVAGGPMGPRMGGGPPGGGGPGGGGGWRGGWRGNGKQPPICRQFTKNGFCRVGDKCQYLHPGVNCPPF